VKLSRLVDDLRAACIAVAIADFLEFLDDDGTKLFVAAENLSYSAIFARISFNSLRIRPRKTG